MYARALILAAVVVAAFTLAAQRQAGAAPSGATTSAPARSARLDQARARSASLDGNGFDITPATVRGIRLLGRLGSAAFSTQLGGAWVAYGEPAETVYPAKRAIEDLDAPPVWQPTPSRSSGCWWLWVFTGMPGCP